MMIWRSHALPLDGDGPRGLYAAAKLAPPEKHGTIQGN